MNQSPPEEQVVYRFRLTDLLYTVTLLAVAIATFGISGIVVAAVIISVWGYVFNHDQPRRVLLPMMLALLLLEGSFLITLLYFGEIGDVLRLLIVVTITWLPLPWVWWK